MIARAILTAGAAVLLTGLPLATNAQTCGEEVDRLASELNVSPDLPSSSQDSSQAQGGAERGDAPTMSDRLAQSGGVIQPPETGRTVTIQPPPGASPSMPTAPAVPPHSAEGPTQGNTETQAAETAQIESLLTAARQAAEEGDERRCQERLAEARDLMDQQRAQTPRAR